MNILFIHRNFPAQFKHLAKELAKSRKNKVVFVCNNEKVPTIPGIEKVVYKLKRKVPDDCHRYLRFYEESIIHGQGAAEAIIRLQAEGFTPDIIIGHSWGPSMFVKEIFPDVPYIADIEWYYNPTNSDVDFGGKVLDVNERARLSCKNSHILEDLVHCDYGIAATHWQKKQIPEIFHSKIKVMHEGIDTKICKPDNKAKFKIPKTNITLTNKDEVLTYATRGMEEYRGFPEFMKAASILMKQRPNLQVVVAGDDRVCYGRKLQNDTWKNKMLRDLEFDQSRLHFVGSLNYSEYIKLLQISSVHMYLTYPFVLSWSLLEAMAVECCIIGSDTPPVEEVITDGYNGILTDFYDINSMVEKINRVLDNPDEYLQIRRNARETVVQNYELKDILKKQIDFIESVVKKQ